jgi:arylsulfatase A-like enzyme
MKGRPSQWQRKPFQGIIKLDVRASKSDWAPYLPAKAPGGAPNILFGLHDDTGLAAWSLFGGLINMSNLQKADRPGPQVLAWHTTAPCSPTLSTLLTGRNHHLNGMAAITEAASGFPSARCRIPAECAR